MRAALPRARALAVELYESPAGKLGSIVLGVWFITSGAFFLVLQLGFIALWLAPFWAPLLAKNIDVVRAARVRARARASVRDECALTPARPIAHANAHTRVTPRGAQSVSRRRPAARSSSSSSSRASAAPSSSSSSSSSGRERSSRARSSSSGAGRRTTACT